MQINFKTMRWSNIFSYGADNFIDLSGHAISQLVGRNGSGKSSIYLILEECLFNTSSKGTKRAGVLNRHVEPKKGFIQVVFEVVDGKCATEYVVTSTRTATTHKLSITKDGIDISGHTTTGTLNVIKEILGKDSKTFASLVIQSGSASLDFLTATDTNRKRWLIELLDLSNYVALHEQCKGLYADIAKKVDEVSAVQSSISRWLATETSKSLEVMQEVDVPSLPPEQLIKLESLKRDIAGIEATNRRIIENNTVRHSLDKFDAKELSEPVGKVDTATLQQLQVTLGEYTAELRALSTEKAKYSKLSPKCPACGQPVDISHATARLEAITKATAELTKSKSSCEASIAEITAHNNKVAERNAKIAMFEKLHAKLDAGLSSVVLDKAELEQQARDLKKALDAVSLSIKQATEHNTNAIKHNARIASLKESIARYERDLGDCKSKLDELTTELSLLGTMKQLFSTNGLVAYKIEASVKGLEALTNQYLTEFSSGRFQLEYRLDGDKLNIGVIDDGALVDITDLSTGERARVTTATLLAIRKLLSSLSTSRINLLFMDETIDTLDAEGRETLIDILGQDQDLNVFLISHGFTHPLLHKISVHKVGKVSHLSDND